MRILEIGHYYSNGIHGAGQHIRTSTVSDSISYYFPEDQIMRIDLTKGKLINFARFFFLLNQSDVVVIFPGANALSIISKLIKIRKKNDRTILIAIGGWLPDYIDDTNIGFFKTLAGIYVQTENMVERLEALGLSNIVLFPNYRILRGKQIAHKSCVDGEKFKMVFCSRIVKDKGVFEIIDAARELKREGYTNFVVDFYGPISNEIEQQFLDSINNYDEINYCGYVDNSRMIETLSDYDIMLFPTYYKGEGFPGVIIESLIAGVPIIASDWKYNKQYVKNDENGVICEPKDVLSLSSSIIKLYNDRKLVNKMKEKCIQDAKQFEEDSVLKSLVDQINFLKQSL